MTGTPIVMYWIRSERESKSPNPGHAVVNEIYDAITGELGMVIRPVDVDDIVIGASGGKHAVRVRGEEIEPDRAFFHTMLMSWPCDRFDIWRHLTAYSALETAGFFITVPVLHNIHNNDKMLTGLGAFGADLPRVPTMHLGTRGYGASGPKPVVAALGRAGLSYPLVVKPAYWGSGFSVFVAHDETELDAILTLAEAAELAMVIQPWLGRSVADCRVYCVDGEPFLTLARRPVGDAVAGNVGQGGAAELVPVPDMLREPARKVAQAVGLPYVCADFLTSADQWWFSEIEIDGASALDDMESMRARFASYRRRFDEFTAGRLEERTWTFRTVPAAAASAIRKGSG